MADQVSCRPLLAQRDVIEHRCRRAWESAMLSVVVLLMVLFCYKGDMDRMAYFLDIYTQRIRSMCVFVGFIAVLYIQNHSYFAANGYALLDDSTVNNIQLTAGVCACAILALDYEHACRIWRELRTQDNPLLSLQLILRSTVPRDVVDLESQEFNSTRQMWRRRRDSDGLDWLRFEFV